MKVERIGHYATVLTIVAFLLAACIPYAGEQGVVVESASFTTEDDLHLSGTMYTPKAREMAVLLAHQGTPGTDQKSWQPFAELLAEKGFAVLTFDFRGRGQSEGDLRVNRLDRDVRAAIRFLRERGFDKIACVGASMGGTACMKVALETDLEGLAVIASTPSLGWPTEIRPEDYPSLTMPKLFICAQGDGVDVMPTSIATMVSRMYKVSPEPKALRMFPGAAHGTELFDTESGDAFRELLVDFLEGLRQARTGRGFG
jgi:pimeloyl-ACP methyl ester carboxylesterase